MKRLIATIVATAFAGSAMAADMAPRTYTKAPPPMAPVASWTGCYISGGGGGVYSKNQHNDYVTTTGVQIGPNQTTGADGWMGSVGAGCDYQFNNFVIGAFGDYDFMDSHGDISTFGTTGPQSTGSQKQDWQWSVGGRVGYVVFPQLMTYVSAGYTESHWKGTTLTPFFTPGVPNAFLPGATRGGWFIGAGDEYALGFLHGLFWKTEYRYSEFDRSNVGITTLPVVTPSGFSETQKFSEHSVRSSLVYRFNWGSPVVAKY